MGSRLRDTVRLFELFCEVSPGDHMNEPSIVRKYPDAYSNEEELKNIPKFTFPCQLENNFVQHYSFVLTSVDSKYTFCFCRYDPKNNSALVLLSHLPWHDIFYKLLNCIANLMISSEQGELNSFLEACRIRPPMPGHTLTVKYNAGLSVFTCQNPTSKLPSIPENFNLTEYFSAVGTDCMAGLWAALLHERRVAIIATKPSRLSACVQAANATLFPMSWQHIFIPILPRHLVDYLLAPMPFLIGVPRAVMESVRMSDIGDIVILDVDKNELRSPFRDLESLPHDLVTSLKKALSDKNALGDAVSRAFLRTLVCLIGGYRDAIRFEQGEKITFSEGDFIKTRKSMQPFLKKILELQIFRQFIDERLDLLNSGRGFNDEFEVECTAFADKVNTGSGARLKQQYRDWAKNVKKEGGAFFRNVREKANPAVQSAVKSVRQGGKNMKSAVKGLKNRMPKAPSHTSSTNTMDSRLSMSSATPVSSDSSSSSPGRGTPAGASALPVDLLTEIQFDALFEAAHRRDSLPNSLPNSSRPASQLTTADKSKTLSPSIPPRIPERPKPLTRYPIIPERKLVDLSDAPLPPPRTAAATSTHNSQFVSNIVKDAGDVSNFHTSTISFGDFGKDKAMLKLTMSSHQRKPLPLSLPPSELTPPPSSAVRRPARSDSAHSAPSARRHPLPANGANGANGTNGKARESFGSETDLIKLDDSPKDLGDFDPLKRRPADKVLLAKTSTDSALLREYGLDFSQFRLLDSSDSSTSATPKGWATFN